MFSTLCCYNQTQSVEMLSFLLYALRLYNSSRCKQALFCLSLNSNHTRSASGLLSANTSLLPPARNCNEVMKWHGFQSGPLLSWPFSRAAVDSTLGGSGRFEALCKNCTNTNVLEDDGICVCAQAFDMIHVTRLSLSLSVILTDCAEHQLIWNINKGNAQNINSPLVPFFSRLTLELMKVRLWCLAWTEEIESVHLLVPEGCVVVRIRRQD